MKAKIIKTEEIVDVYHEPQHGQVSNIYKESVFVNGRMWQENELEFIESNGVDLEKEIQQHINDCLDIKFPTTNIELIKKDVEYTARKFFELGLKAQKGE